MTTIVMNTLRAAVTEYDWSFQSITPTHAGSAAGLFEIGGTADDGAAIDATVLTGEILHGPDVKKRLEPVYFGIRGTGNATLRVRADGESNTYNFAVRTGGVSRGVPGLGIRANYVAFGMRNASGADFTLNFIDVPFIESKKRRVF